MTRAPAKTQHAIASGVLDRSRVADFSRPGRGFKRSIN